MTKIDRYRRHGLGLPTDGPADTVPPMVRSGRKRFANRADLTVAVALFAIAGCSSTAPRVTPSGATPPPTPISAAPSTDAESTGLGTLTVTIGAPGGQSVSSETLQSAVAALRARLEMRDDPAISIDGETIVVMLSHTAEGTSPDVVWPGPESAVYLRPVSYCYSPTPGSTTTIAETVSDPTRTELLNDRTGQLCQVGPSRGDATVFEAGSATAELTGGSWGVTVSLKEGDAGEGVWNAIAAECFEGSDICPSHQLAIEIYGIIQSAPTVNAPTFAGSVQISGAFTRAEATDLASTINAGGAPTTLAVIESTFTPED